MAKTITKQFEWTGKGNDINRPLELCRPCPCGCDARGGVKGVGYITGGDKKDGGFSLWIENENVYQSIKKVFIANKLLVLEN